MHLSSLAENYTLPRFYDCDAWTPANEPLANNFDEFRRHYMIPNNNKYFLKLCNSLYSIIKHEKDLIRINKEEDGRNTPVLHAIEGLKTFIYNRVEGTEHYSDVPRKSELVRLQTDLMELYTRYAGTGYDFRPIAKFAMGELDEYIEHIDDINEAYTYIKRSGCIVEPIDLEEHYEGIANDLKQRGIDAIIEYPYCTDLDLVVSIDLKTRKADVDQCMQDNTYKFVKVFLKGGRRYLMYTFDHDNSIFAW